MLVLDNLDGFSLFFVIAIFLILKRLKISLSDKSLYRYSFKYTIPPAISTV